MEGIQPRNSRSHGSRVGWQGLIQKIGRGSQVGQFGLWGEGGIDTVCKACSPSRGNGGMPPQEMFEK